MDQIRKKTLGGYPAVGVVLSITLALIVIGLFGLILSYSNQLERLIRQNIAVKVYLKNTLSETQLRQLQQTIGEKEYIAKTESPITFISKDDAKKELGDVGDFQEILGDNPLKDMLEVKIDPAYHDSTHLASIKKELEQVGGVLEVVYERDMLEDINKNFTRISLVLIGVAAILLVTVVLLINNTLRLALFSQRFLIRSMQLVGARQSFIQRPFLVRAAGYGIIAGVIAAGLLTLLTQYAFKRVENLSLLHDEKEFIMVMGLVVGCGAVLAVISTFFAIRRYIHMTLDELY